MGEMEWCTGQLQRLHARRSVSDMTTVKVGGGGEVEGFWGVMKGFWRGFRGVSEGGLKGFWGGFEGVLWLFGEASY